MRRWNSLAAAILLLLSVAEIQARDIRVNAGHDAAAGRLVNKAVTLAKKGEQAAALRSFDEAIRIDPSMWPAYFGRARVLMRQRKWQLAKQDVDEVVRMQPRFFATYLLRSSAHQQLGNYAAALADLKTAASLASNEQYPFVLKTRAWFRATCPDASFRDGKQAVADAKQACQRSGWKDAGDIDTLAAACAETGDFGAAIRYEEQALAIGNFDRSSGEPGAQKRLALYKQHRPFRQLLNTP